MREAASTVSEHTALTDRSDVSANAPGRPREVASTTTVQSMRPASPPGRHNGLLMAGCQDTEYSYDAFFQNRANGAFSFVALAILEALPASATYADFHKAIRKKLPSQQYPQSPNLFGSSAMKKWKVFA